MKSLTILFIFFTALNLHSQTIFKVLTYNGPGNQMDVARAIFVDRFENIYVTGNSWGGSSKDDYATIKYDRIGNQLWVSRYNGTGNHTDISTAIVVDNAGNVYVTGWSYSGSDSYSADYVTIKYNSSGVQQWVKRYDGPGADCYGYDYAYAIGIDANGDIYVTGVSGGTQEDYATIKYSSSGVQLWIARYDGVSHKNDEAKSIFVSPVGDVYVTGSSVKDNEGKNYVTIKYNTNGQPQWVKSYNGNGNGDDIGNSIFADGGSNVFVTGSSKGSSSRLDYLTLKYSPSGDTVWTSRYNGSANDTDIASKILLDVYGYIYVTGSSKGMNTNFDITTLKINPNGTLNWERRVNGQSNGNDKAADMVLTKQLCPSPVNVPCWIFDLYVTGYSEGYLSMKDYLTMRYAANGDEMWSKRYAGYVNGDDIPTSIATTDNNTFVYVTGTSGSDYATVWFVKASSTPNNPLNNSVDNSYKLIKNYPNPFNPKINFEINLLRKTNLTLKIYDILGREIKTIVNNFLNEGIYHFTWDASSYASGIYFYKLITDIDNESGQIILSK